jgi:hypothetical protein
VHTVPEPTLEPVAVQQREEELEVLLLARVPASLLGCRGRSRSWASACENLSGTVLVVIEPQIEGPDQTPVFLAVSANGWHLAVSETAHEALYGLARQADIERQALLTGEILPQTPPSAA